MARISQELGFVKVVAMGAKHRFYSDFLRPWGRRKERRRKKGKKEEKKKMTLLEGVLASSQKRARLW